MKLRIIIEAALVIIFIITIPIAIVLNRSISADDKGRESAIQYLQKGDQLFSQGRTKYNDASVQYWEALKHDPKLADAHFRLAEIYYEHIWNYETLHKLQELEKINAKYPGLYRLMGKLYHRMGEVDNAYNAFQNSIKLEPHDPESHYYLGTIYQQKNNKEEAIKEYEQAVTVPISPSYKDSIVKSYLQLGRIYKTDKDPDKALVFLKKAFTVEPESVEVISELKLIYSQKAGLYRNEKKFDEAARMYEEIVKLDPNNVENTEYYMELGDIYRDGELYDKATSAYNSAAKLDPLNLNAFVALKELELIKSGKVSQ